MSKRVSYKRSYSKSNKKMYKRSSKRAPSNKTLAKKVKHIENDLMELKYFDYSFGPTNVTNTGVILEGHMLITQGDTASTRTGNKINPTSLQLRMGLNTVDTLLVPVKVRMIAFWDRQANGASPVLANINNGLLDNSTIGTIVYAPRNLNTVDRYTIVYDKVMVINPTAWTSYTSAVPNVVGTAFPIEKYISKAFKLGRQIRYDTNTGALADLVSNAFYIAFVSDAASDEPVMEGGIRLYFRDS